MKRNCSSQSCRGDSRITRITENNINMIKEIHLKDRKIEYELQYKTVKNINLRVKPDGKVCVSASRRVSVEFIEKFMQSKADFILKALEKYDAMKVDPLKEYFSEKEIRELILKMCKEAYPYYEAKGVLYPEIRFRRMVSRWGSCMPTKGVLTFNTNLMYAPKECAEYVVLHEFTHFLQANHSSEFYMELSKVCPDWKKRKNMLKGIVLRGR